MNSQQNHPNPKDYKTHAEWVEAYNAWVIKVRGWDKLFKTR
jgi:hypothetical protein